MRSGDPGTLPSSIRSLCEGGVSWDKLGYKSQFAARKSVLFYMCTAGWTFDDACRYILADQTKPVYDLWGDIERLVSHSERQKRLFHDWQSAKVFAENHITERPDVLAICGELRALVATWNWRGQGGRTDRDVILVAIGFAEESGGLAVRLSEREVALRAGISNRTALVSLGRLRKAGWLQLTKDQRTSRQAVQYRLRKDVLHKYPNSVLGLENTQFGYSCNTVNLAASKLGIYLGKGPQAVLRVLSDNPLHAAEIARRANVHRTTAGRALRILGREKLAQEQPDGTWVLGPEDAATYDPGGRDIPQERKERFTRDRENYREALDNYGRRAA